MAWKELTENIKKIVKDKQVQLALERAGRNYENKHFNLKDAEPRVDEFKEEIRRIKDGLLRNIDKTIARIEEVFGKLGVKVIVTTDSEEARRIIGEIVGSGNIIVKGKSMVCEEIGLREYLEGIGNEIWETDVGEWIIQIAKDKPMHVITPAIHYTRERVAKLLQKFFKRKFDPDNIPEMVRAITGFLRNKYFESTVGILGANAIAVEDGAILTIHNEGNIRFIASMAKKLIFVTDITKVIDTVENAIKTALVISRSAGYRIAGYIDIFTLRNINGNFGPKEIYLILVDNGRREMLRDDEFRQIGYCLRCGACMYVCPLFRTVGRYFGGPIYMGGIGLLLSYFITKDKEKVLAPMFMCLECRRCFQVCPMEIHTSKLARKIVIKHIRESLI